MKKIICGDIVLFKQYCPVCQEYVLVGKKNYFCECGYNFNDEIITETRILCTSKRKHFSLKIRNQIKERQNNCCFWRGIDFDTLLKVDYKIIKIKMHLDHVNPYAYTQNNELDNLVGSCHRCNGHKSSHMFENNDETRKYLINMWEQDIKRNHVSILK